MRPVNEGERAPAPAEAPAGGGPWELRLWRDHDPRTHGIRGIDLGRVFLRGDPRALAAELFAGGVRRVRLRRPVDLSGASDPRTVVDGMILIQELTAWGTVVDWTVRWGDHRRVWEQLQHLYPPREFEPEPSPAAGSRAAGAPPGQGEPDELARWRRSFFLCKCCYRRGPGFVQVRDRRSGVLSRFVIDDPRYLGTLDRLLGGAPVADLPPDVLRDFVAEGLAGVAGPLGWWLPYRVRRWPWPVALV